MAEKVPRIVPGIDLRQFKLDPTDGFLLTRVDGRLTPKDLSRETGLPDFTIERALQKLEKLGVVQLIDPNAPPPAPPPPERTGPVGFSALEVKYDPKELEEEVDVPPDTRKRILDLYYRLDDLDHYTLLGVAKDVDKKGAKRAYFELAAAFHPDRYFKKNLGSYKAKMEVVFAKVTEAHDTLVDRDKRAEYDAYLSEVATTKGLEALLERALSARGPSVPPPDGAGAATGTPPAATQPPPSGGLSATDAELRARREALARRLRGAGAPVPSKPAPAAPPPGPSATAPKFASSQDAVDALKKRYEQRVEQVAVSQSSKHAEAAEAALARNDVVGAASALALALKYAPDDLVLGMRYQEIKSKADAQLLESYLKQAQYEEKQEHWPEAARSWERVVRIKPDDARASDRAAMCLLKGKGDMHLAAEHAKRAVLAAPKVAAYHLTLAEVYLHAGLLASAKRAAESGLAVDANDEKLKELLKRVTK